MCNRPARMFRNDRPVIDEFEDVELLYRRVPAKELFPPDHDKLIPEFIRIPDISCNRSTQSEPEDVIIEHPECGIAQILVGSIPDSMIGENDVAFDFRVEHAPEENNYSHSEIRFYKAGVRTTNSNQIHKKVKTEIRYELSKHFDIHTPPP